MVATRIESLEKRAIAVLGLSHDYTPDELKRAYRHAALEYHPDLNAESEAESKFRLAVQSYLYLAGDRSETALLEDDQMVGSLVGKPMGAMELSYEDWMQKRFYRDAARAEQRTDIEGHPSCI